MSQKLSPKEAIQNSEFYRSLTPYMAVGIAEGFEPSENYDENVAAWQYIYDNGMYKHLQGFFGRSLREMIDKGIVYA